MIVVVSKEKMPLTYSSQTTHTASNPQRAHNRGLGKQYP